MQIHEITLLQEGLGTMLKTMGSDLKNAVKAPVEKAKYLMKEPGSLTSTGAYNNARDKYYTSLVGPRQSEKAASTTTDLTAWAKNLASEWSRQPRPSSQAPVAQAQPSATTKPATAPVTAPTTPVTPQATKPGYGPAYKNVTTNVPAGVPNPMAATGSPQPTTAPTTAAAKPTTPAPANTTPAVAKPRTGGKQPGVVSQTPNAIRKRTARAQGAVAPGQNAFGQMAQQLSGANKSKSSTGGTITQMPTGQFHAANPKNPTVGTPAVATPAATATAKPAPKWLTPTTKISKASAGKPTADEYAKLQQRIAAADAKQKGVTNEAFSDLPGAKPAVGGAVAPSVTARPAGIKRPPPLQSRYAQNFKTWAASKVADKSSGLGLADVEKIPGMSRTLNQALAQVVTTQQNPNDNIAAVEQYFLTVGQAMQQLSARQKTIQQQNNPKRQSASALTPLSSILNPNQIEALQKKGETPEGKWEIITQLKLQ